VREWGGRRREPRGRRRRLGQLFSNTQPGTGAGEAQSRMLVGQVVKTFTPSTLSAVESGLMCQCDGSQPRCFGLVREEPSNK